MISTRSGTRWPRVPAAFVATMLSGHSVLGLAFGALIYLVCLTGTAAVFIDELQVWEQPNAPVVGSVDGAAIGKAMRLAYEAAGSAGLSDVYASPHALRNQHLIVAALGQGIDRSWDADAAGSLAVENKARWSDFVGDLHMTLMLPHPWGGMLVGIVGVALFALLLSGVLSHPRIFRDAFALRLGGSARLREADLHNRLSVWGLPFHLAVTLTGAFFGLSFLLVLAVAWAGYGGDTARVTQVLEGPRIAPDPAPAPFPDIAAMLAQVPGHPTFVGVENPGTAGQHVLVEATVPGRLVRGEQFFFDGNARLIAKGGFADGAIGLQAYAAAASLHFGTFGGIPVKLLYGILGLALSAISAGGITIWLIRRRDRGRPARRLEKAWMAVVWGSPIALALSGAGSLVAGIPPSPAFWGLLLLIVAVSLAASNGQLVSRRLRWVLVGGLVALVAADVVRFGPHALTGYAVWVNCAFLAVAGVIGALNGKGRAEPPAA
ncbi:MAG TPA: PepSY-associated TM helix domain-containing protein [Alphaproteobacteria bacterium]|jgi:uncharacterized iron-regulated membrane protein|nr:PepSY-associated TM helix domain-containing protein [Alphaproteobacteria bacterium]